MNRLKLNLDEPYKVKRETKEEVVGKSTPYSEVYEKAYKALEEIVKSFDSKGKEEFEYNNNIIAFTGERGSGKTSTMLSFADSLDEAKYEILDIFEPNNTEENMDILEIFIAKMCLNFKEKMKDIKENHRRELLELFEQLYKNLRVFNEKKEKFYENEDINNLLNTADAIKMKKKLAETVERYLLILGESSDKKLIFMIDDFDLNFEKQYSILEKIRKYLIIPNLIILTCFKKELMLMEISNGISKKNQNLEGGQKYFEKIFPVDRIIEMPKDISLKLLAPETVQKLFLFDKNQALEQNIIEEMTVEKGFMKLFEQKIIKIQLSEIEKKIIVPETIRDIVNQFIFLKNLSEANRDSGENLLKYIEQVSLDEVLSKEIKKINKLTEKIKLNTNWIEKIEKLDRMLEEDINLKERKNLLMKKLYFLNYLNGNLNNFSNCIPTNFSFVDLSDLNSSFLKKEFDGRINSNILENLKNFMFDDYLYEKYSIIFNKNYFLPDNIIKFLIVNSNINFEEYCKIMRNLFEKKMKIGIDSTLQDIIEFILKELKKINMFELNDLDIYGKLGEKEISKIDIYIFLTMFLKEEVSRKISYISDYSFIKILQFFYKVPIMIENLKNVGIIYDLEEFNDMLQIVEEFIGILKIKTRDLNSLIRKIKKIQNELEKKKETIEFKKNRFENTISRNKEKVKSNSTRINTLRKVNQKMQEEYEKAETTATLKGNLLSLIRRNEDIIQNLENEKYNLHLSNVVINEDKQNLEIENMSDIYIQIMEEFEESIEMILKQLNIDEEDFRQSDETFFEDWISILES